MSNPLSAFVTARISEDEAWAKEGLLLYGPDAEYVKARILREAESKRAVVAAYESVLAECHGLLRENRPRKYGEYDGLFRAMTEIASVWSDHKDFAAAVEATEVR